MFAIFKKELKVYYTSLFAYIYYAIFFFVTGLFFSVKLLDTYKTEFGYYVVGTLFYVMIVIIPFCTMKLFSMERKHKTDQLLFTAPVSSFSVLTGKYLATVVFSLLPLLLSVIYPVLISVNGEMSWRFVASAYIGCILSILVLLSIGMFVSTLTTNIVLAVVISYVIYVIAILGRLIEAMIPSSSLYQLIHTISVYNIFNDMLSGIVRSGDVIYLLTVAVLFFGLTWFVLESRRRGKKQIVVSTVCILVIACIISFVSFHNTKVYDCTPEQLLTLSEETFDAMQDIQNETTVYYLGLESTANATYKEFLNQYHKINDKINIEYKDYSIDSEFKEKYLSNVTHIYEASMLVVSGERFIYLDASNYIKSTMETKYESKDVLNIESQLTNAIYNVNKEDNVKLVTVTGHNEEMLNTNFKSGLSLNGYDVDSFDLPSKMSALHDAFTDNIHAAIVNAPKVDYTQEEIKELKAFLKNGGNLIMVLDPLVEDNPNLLAFLKEYGLDVKPGIVVERDETMYTENTQYYLVPNISKNDFTKDIMNEKILIFCMTSKGIVPEGSGNGYSCTDLLMTSGTAFSKVDNFEDMNADGENDFGGPFSLASCSVNPEEGSIFLITSNIFFSEEADALSNGANRSLFLDVVNQLTGTEAFAWIDGVEVGDQVAVYPYKLRTPLKIITVIVIPVFFLIIGIFVVFVRNHNILYRISKKRKENETEKEEHNLETSATDEYE